jgi:hypothetical protein
MVIEVTVCHPDGTVIDRAEADTPENALFAAHTLWEEGLEGLVGERRIARFYIEGLLVHQQQCGGAFS